MTDLLITPDMMGIFLDGLIQKTINGRLKWKVPGLYDDKPVVYDVLTSFSGSPKKAGKCRAPETRQLEDEFDNGELAAPGPRTHYIKFSGRTLSVTRPVAEDHPNTVLVFYTKVARVDEGGSRAVLINLSFVPDGFSDGAVRDPQIRVAQIREYNLKVQMLCAAIDSYRNGVQVLEDQMAEDANIKAGEAAMGALGDLLK